MFQEFPLTFQQSPAPGGVCQFWILEHKPDNLVNFLSEEMFCQAIEADDYLRDVTGGFFSLASFTEVSQYFPSGRITQKTKETDHGPKWMIEFIVKLGTKANYDFIRSLAGREFVVVIKLPTNQYILLGSIDKGADVNIDLDTGRANNPGDQEIKFIWESSSVAIDLF